MRGRKVKVGMGEEDSNDDEEEEGDEEGRGER